MATTTVPTALQVEQWSKKYFKNFIRENRFYRYMSEKGDNVIYMNYELGAKPGTTITIGLIAPLSGTGVYGDDTLEDNEEQLLTYGDTITVNQIRNAVARGEFEQRKTMLQILEAAEPQLKKWAMETLRDDIIDAFDCYNLDGTTDYSSDTEANKDAALAANTDRVVAGILMSNVTGAAGDHSAMLATLDTTNDLLNLTSLPLARRVAESADPLITPITVSEDEEYFVCFAGTNPFRDFKAALDTVHQNAAPRDQKNNPIFRDGDLVHGGVVVRKIPEMTSLGNVGTSSAPVYSCAFCGQQAVGVAWGQRTKVIRNGPEGRDYGNVKGIGVCEVRGVKKFEYNSKFHGMVQLYVAAAADA